MYLGVDLVPLFWVAALSLAAAFTPANQSPGQEQCSLVDQLKRLCHSSQADAGIRVNLIVEDQIDVPDHVQLTLYRIAEEAIRNVVEHARASTVNVRLCCTRSERLIGQPVCCKSVLLAVLDDGCGFDVTQVDEAESGLGDMRAWAQYIGATLFIDSFPGEGTQLTVLWEQVQAGKA
jgi:signal transduction histidine kinase